MRTLVCVVAVFGLTGLALAGPYLCPDAELLLPDFTPLAGYSGSGSTLDGKVDTPGPGVAFLMTLRGPDDGKLGIGDQWETNPAAGLGWDPVLSHYTSLASYTSYEMLVSYVAGLPGSTVDVALILNTGLCGPSGFPSSDPTNDTFWSGNWVALSLGQTATLALDFDWAEAWNISDNKWPHTGGGLGWLNGQHYAIDGFGGRDRYEISNIGLQIADFNGDALGGQVVLRLNAPIPEPASVVLLAAGVAALLRRRRRRAFPL